MKILIILILLSFKLDWLSYFLSKVQVIILKLKSEMKVFLLEENIIVSQQTIKKHKWVQLESGIIYCCWLKNLTTNYM